MHSVMNKKVMHLSL